MDLCIVHGRYTSSVFPNPITIWPVVRQPSSLESPPCYDTHLALTQSSGKHISDYVFMIKGKL
ncbi:Uncharacterized protein APZ42_002353 [Daphnia magna]|uniref:Uncharacterized protein n=1 Tax=Daphnia magna TaxID=35525 RepID=A0A164IBJ6_9CRUS|nr:Uncharacterized protein APZ42_002353 [Daphnia magna]